MIDRSVLPIPRDVQHIFEAASMHYGVIQCVSDPKNRGRCLIECPSMSDEGAKNWVGWCDYAGMPHGSNEQNGDMGLWWPPVPGQLVLVGFEGGNVKKPFYIPGGPWKDDDPYLPKEVVNTKERGASINHIRALKSPFGHALVMDDNPQDEGMYLCDWTGSSFYWMNPSKEGKVSESGECAKSNLKEGGNRGDKLACAGTSSKPSELTATGEVCTGYADVNGQGYMCRAKDNDGQVAIWAGKKMGDVTCSIVFDTHSKSIILTAGETQMTISGEAEAIYVTKQMIWEAPYDKSWTDAIKKKFGYVKDFFKERYSSSGSNSGGSSGGGGTSSGGTAV